MHSDSRFDHRKKYCNNTSKRELLLVTGLICLLLASAYANTPIATYSNISAFGLQTYTLSWQGYDYDNKGEVSVLINNQLVASLPTADTTQNNNVWKSFSLDITKYVVSGTNSITFKQNLYSSALQSVKVTGSTVLLSDSTYHAMSTGGTTSVTYKFNTGTTTTTSSSSGTYTLTFQGYDYDNKGEVSIYVNSRLVTSLPTVESSQNNNVWKSFSLDISNYVVSGTNTIMFKQNLYSSAIQSVKVTRSTGVLLSDSTYHAMSSGGTSSVSYTFSTSSTTSTTTTTTTSFSKGTSWNSKVACTPIKVKITDITARATGSTSYANSMFSPGITVPSYAPSGSTAKRWLTSGPTPSGWISPGPPCSITNNKGQVIAVFVEIDGVKLKKPVDEDYASVYNPINGGHSMPNGKSWPDTTFNIYDPNVSSGGCSSPTDPNCYARIHVEIDHDWKAAGYCGSGTACDNVALASKTSADSTLIDVQGFVYWDPGKESTQWHSYNGWELHPLTAWRVH